MNQQMSSLPIPSQVIETLRSAGHVAVLTGAGVSAESNIPTFRDAQTGLWAKYSPEELATPQAFRRNPQLVWDWYAWRRELVSRADPNPGHFALVELAGLVPKLTLITQNVDGLHQRAGSDDVIELHGSITRIVCSSDRRVAETWSEAGETPPRCPDCDSYLRPDVVWFGEALPTQALHRAFQAAETCDLFLSVGTSALVHPAASLPFTALERRTPTIEINPDETPLTPHATFVLPGPSGQILPALVAGLKN